MSALEIEYSGEYFELEPGSEFTIGRIGSLRIDDNPYLHRHFLNVVFADGFWWIANIGSRTTAILSDPAGQSRSVLVSGARLPLVFKHTVLTFSAGHCHYELNLTVETPVWEQVSCCMQKEEADTTVGETTFTESQLLAILAVAEPLLRRTGTGAWQIPTAVAAAKRLGWTQTRFNRKLDNVCDKLDRVGVPGLKGGPGKQALGRRAALAEYAVTVGIVTAEQLPALDAEYRRNLEGDKT